MSPTQKPIRVFQVATGNVGSEMIKRIATQPDLELIGLHCYSPEKIGKDAVTRYNDLMKELQAVQAAFKQSGGTTLER